MYCMLCHRPMYLVSTGGNHTFTICYYKCYLCNTLARKTFESRDLSRATADK